MGLLQFVQKEKAHQYVQLPQDPQVSEIHNDTSGGGGGLFPQTC